MLYNKVACKVFLLVLLFVALATREVLATQHVVTWDVSTDFSSWASGRTFKVGDKLVFKYTTGLHSVVELSSDKEYKNCDLSNSVGSMNAGNDEVKLTKPGTRYFTCGTLGHCGQGMKLKVKTVVTDETPSPSSSSSSSSSSSPPPPSSTTSVSAARRFHSMESFVLVVASVIIGLISMG